MIDKALQNLRQSMRAIGRPVSLMEVCGTHTMAAFRAGLRTLLPADLQLLSGPGCPVCVTPSAYVDQAVELSLKPGIMIATFGDMVRVPGSRSSLEKSRAQGAEVLVVYSPLDALEAARRNPGRQVVFLGVGFETTAPAVAWSIKTAADEGIPNYLVYSAHKTMPPAMNALLQSGESKVDGFLCPGHVSVIIGSRAYGFIAEGFHVPCVVAGFEPLDMLQAIGMLLRQVEKGQAMVENQYRRSVAPEGNITAQKMLAEVFEPGDAAWRGLGMLPGSGLRIRERYAAHDARIAFSLAGPEMLSPEPPGCRCGDVLRGVCTPLECGLYQKDCTPAHPVGACMVSGEGTCAAYYKYEKQAGQQQ
ncbi:hydrogenase formation protein HypD [candidate division FCPU426 bacterium]|nr:hydrogenase formation protein HypD [candidate division FCPU426 bacterium]